MLQLFCVTPSWTSREAPPNRNPDPNPDPIHHLQSLPLPVTPNHAFG